MEATMVKISALGHKDEFVWLNESPLRESVELYEPAMLHAIPSSEHCLESLVIVGSNVDLRYTDLANLIRQGHSLFIYDILSLTEEELGKLFRLAEEAGVFIFPRLPHRMWVSSEERTKPIVATIEVGIAESNNSVSWLNHCINAVAMAVSLVPFGVKRTKFVNGDGLGHHCHFFGCQLEFENSSLASVSVSINGEDQEHIRVIGQGGVCQYSRETGGSDGLYPLLAQAQLAQFLDAIARGDAALLAQEVQQSQQILHIYYDLKARFVHA